MGIMPALLMSTSTRPKPSTALWMSASTSARFVTSVASPMALPPLAEISRTTASIRSERRAPSTTFAPCPARSFAVLSPMPLLAPVITTTLSVMFDVFISFSPGFKNLLFGALRSLRGYLKNQLKLDRHAERKARHSVHQPARAFVFSENVLQQR